MDREIAGIRIHYALEGQGPTRVLLLHGWGCSAELMKPVADALSPDMTVLRVDFPGFGQSGRPPEPWGVPEYAASLLKLLEALDFLPCAVIAHSFGARVTLLLAAEDPARFEKLIITGGAGLRAPQTEAGKKRSEAFRRGRKLAEGLGRLPGMAPLADRAMERLRKRYGSADYNALDAEMRKTFVRVVNQDLADCLPKIQQPTLLLWGESDTETPLWMGQKMEREIPGAALVVLPGTHFMYLEQSARFNAIVRSFLLS